VDKHFASPNNVTFHLHDICAWALPLPRRCILKRLGKEPAKLTEHCSKAPSSEGDVERQDHGKAPKPFIRGEDPTIDYRMMMANTEDFMSLYRCSKPTIAKIHGFAVAGGSDIALCCDLVVMEDTAKIGYPPARVWGIPTTMQWINRLGPEKAKRMLFTGDLVTGKQAKETGPGP
jgi:enoyl-CoA hydratase/carnithine racemase